MNCSAKPLRWLICIVICLLPAAADAALRLPAIFSDHMVLQQNQKTVVWGWSDAGQQVTVTIANDGGQELASAQATVGEAGKWQVELTPPAAGGPYSMTIRGAETITFNDLLVGEVWVCSGQSNMQWPVSAGLNPEQEIAQGNHPNIRLFTVARKVAQQPEQDVQGQWQPCTPETVPGFSAVAYFFGRTLQQELNVPIGLVNSSWGGTLAEAWTSRPTLEQHEEFQPILERGAQFEEGKPHQPAVLFNGMISPIVPYAIRGVIWYQGESNVARAAQYEKLFPALITDWRQQWKQGDFPFLFVQLAPYRYQQHDPRAAAELREAQRTTLKLPNTGMAVTMDIGNVSDIHPKNKQEVGRRLALWALATTYDKDVVYSGPLYETMSMEGNKVQVRFSHAEGGLVAKGGELEHFEVAGEDGEFVPATATIEDDMVVVSSEKVPHPTAVRYAWHDDAEPHLFNEAGLPASPFRTDSFPRLSEEAR